MGQLVPCVLVFNALGTTRGVVQRHGAQGSAGPDPALLSGITFLQMFDQHTTVTIRYKLACADAVCVRVCRLCVLPRCEALDLWSVSE